MKHGTYIKTYDLDRSAARRDLIDRNNLDNHRALSWAVVYIKAHPDCRVNI